MSLLWRDRIIASLAPRGVAAVRLGRGFSPRVQRQVFVPGGNAAGWQPAVQSLQGLLEQTAWQQADLWLVLSNEYVRYAVVAIDPKLKHVSARDAYARLQMEQRFGEMIDKWALKISYCSRNAAVVSAVEHSLLEEIERIALNKVRWVSLQPHLMTVYNRLPSSADAQVTALLLAEHDRLLLALFDKNGWHSVINRRVAVIDSAAVQGLINSEMAIHGLAVKHAWAAGLPEALMCGTDPRWQACPVATLPAINDPDTFGLVMSALT